MHPNFLVQTWSNRYNWLVGADQSLAKIRHIVGEYHEGLNEHKPAELQEFLGARGFAVRMFSPLDEEGGHFHAFRR